MRPGIRNFLISFVISALLFSAIAYGAVQMIRLTVFNSGEDESSEPAEQTSEQNSDQPSDPTSGSSDKPVRNGGILNFVLIGTDYQPDLYDDYTVPDDSLQKERVKSADSILFVSYIPKNSLLLACSVPTETMTELDGISMTLGETYHYKGAAFVTEKVSALIGQPIPYYAAVSIADLRDIVDDLGGIRYDVPQDMQYESVMKDVRIDLKKGEQQLNGNQVTQLLRFNGYEDSHKRTDFQTEFFYAFLSKNANFTNKRNYVNVFGMLLPYLETNVTLSDLTNHLSVLFGYRSMSFTPVSYPGAYADKYFMPNVDSAKTLFATYNA